MKPKHFIMLAAIAMMAACTTNEDEFDLSPEQPAKQSLSELRSFEEALQIANNSISLLNNGEATRASSTRKINLADCKAVMRNAATRSSEGSNDTLMYVFNFEDNQGFAIVSASKSTEGLLAVTEKGYYDPEEGTNVENFNFFMEKARDYVAKAPKLRFPPDIPVIFERDSIVTIHAQKGPFITVNWGQEFPEGELCPNGLSGCVPTAIGQILSWWCYPTSMDINYPGADISVQALNWSQIKAHQTGHELDSCQTQVTHEAIGRMMRELGEMTLSTYSQTSPSGGPRTYSAMLHIPRTLKLLGYNEIMDEPYNFDSLAVSHLNLFHPLLIFGACPEGGGSYHHTWVFDGYIKNITYCYHLIRVSANSNVWIIDSVTTTTQRLCHYNWGWYGDCNGYFSSGVFDTQEPDIPSLSSEHDYVFSGITVIPVYRSN